MCRVSLGLVLDWIFGVRWLCAWKVKKVKSIKIIATQNAASAAGPIGQKEQSISHLHEHNLCGLTNQAPLIPPIPSMFHPQLKQADRAPDERSSHLYREAQSR